MSKTTVALPSLVALRSHENKKLMQYVKEEGETKGFVNFRGEHEGSQEALFEVHGSRTGHGLVHIRCSYNNRYLVLNKDNCWIAATAVKPEEDQSKRSCTLLRPTSVNGNPKTIRLTNVYNENYLCMWRAAEPYYACVLAYNSVPDKDFCDVYNVIDMSPVQLPKCVPIGNQVAKCAETKQVDEKGSHNTSYKVKIPPNTKVTVQISATSGPCEVPFVNNYSFYTQLKEESLIITRI